MRYIETLESRVLMSVSVIHRDPLPHDPPAKTFHHKRHDHDADDVIIVPTPIPAVDVATP